ncbi:MAG TPA: hypothetical protein VLE91_03395 [Candidatus Saccharimonadales bacterium]|nr:hypothetical protein [Candidatus Saccharimonadales bacterium]
MPKSFRPGFIGAFAILGVICLFVAATILFNTVLIKKENKTEATPSGIPVDANISDQTANWKTYTNKKFNYTFKYPPTLTVSTGVESLPGNENLRRLEGTAVINLINDNKILFQISSLPEYKSLDQIKIDLNDKSGIKNITSTTLGSTLAIKYTDNSATYITLLKNNLRYDFYAGDKELLDQILSTFKFTN